MLNKVILIGNTTRPVEFKYTPNGASIATTALAVSRKWNDKMTGDKREETMFVDLTIMGKSAEVANQYLTKGKKVMIEGRLVFNQWTDQTGAKRSKHSVYVENFEFLGGDRNETMPEEDYGYDSAPQYAVPQQQQAYRQPTQNAQPAQAQVAPKPLPDIQINDDEIPF